MSETAICIEQLSKRYLNTPVFSGLSAQFPSGRIIGLLGENGIGKTTLLKVMAGLIKPDNGRVMVPESSKSKVLSGSSLSQSVSWLFSPQDFYPFFRVKDSIQYYTDFYPDFDKENCIRLMDDWNMPLERKIRHLSRGEAERVCLFLALCRKVPLYFMDEPAAGFDVKLKRDLVRILLSELEEGATVILATHLLRDFGDLFDTLAVMTKNGICMTDADAIREKGLPVEDYYLEVIA